MRTTKLFSENSTDSNIWKITFSSSLPSSRQLSHLLKIKSDFLSIMPPELLKQEYLKRGSDGFYIDAVPPLDKYEKKAAN